MKIRLYGTEISKPLYDTITNVKHIAVNIYNYDNVMTVCYMRDNELKVATVMLSDYQVIIEED